LGQRHDAMSDVNKWDKKKSRIKIDNACGNRMKEQLGIVGECGIQDRCPNNQ